MDCSSPSNFVKEDVRVRKRKRCAISVASPQDDAKRLRVEDVREGVENVKCAGASCLGDSGVDSVANVKPVANGNLTTVTLTNPSESERTRHEKNNQIHINNGNTSNSNHLSVINKMNNNQLMEYGSLSQCLSCQCSVTLPLESTLDQKQTFDDTILNVSKSEYIHCIASEGLVPWLKWVVLPLLLGLTIFLIEWTTHSSILSNEFNNSWNYLAVTLRQCETSEAGMLQSLDKTPFNSVYSLVKSWEITRLDYVTLMDVLDSKSQQLESLTEDFARMQQIVLEMKPKLESCQLESAKLNKRLEALTIKFESSIQDKASLELVTADQSVSLEQLNHELQSNYEACLEAMDAIALASAQKRIWDRKQLQEAHKLELATQADIYANAMNAVAHQAEIRRRQGFEQMQRNIQDSAQQALDAINAVARSRVSLVKSHKVE